MSMAKPTKASKAAEAILTLDASAIAAQERITKAAEKAQKLIDEACATATAALEQSSRIPDKRNLDGSYQWDRGDRYRRGSDDRLQRIEDKLNGEKTLIGNLEVGQAKREEQITGLIADVDSVRGDMEHLRTSFAVLNKEHDSSKTTMRELTMEIRDVCDDKIGIIRDETRKDKIRNQQYVIGIVVGMIVLFITSTIFGFLRV